ncbi:MAG: MFS transporter [Bacteroidia bacterium]|nr:MFS transporter [Bacteroidia bacterium]
MLGLLQLYRKSFSNLQKNIWILAVAMFINRSGSMVLLFTSLYMTRELHFSIGQAGVVMSFYGIGSVLGSYAGGWLTDRKNYFDVMVASLLLSGLVLFSLLFVKTLYGIAAVIFIYALTADAFRPANSKAIAVYSDALNRTRSVSLVRLAVNLGFTVGPAVGGFIALYLGYKWLFVIDALTTFGAAGLLYFYLPRQTLTHTPQASKVLANSSTSAYRDLRYLCFIFLVALYGTCFFQIFASVPQYFSKVCHYNEDVIGLLLALNGFMVVLVEMPMILKLEGSKRIFPFIIAGTACLPVCFALLYFGGEQMAWAILYTIIITLSEVLAMPFMMNYSLSRPVKERQGQYAALYSIAFGIANIAAPVAGLGIANLWGFDKMFLVLIGMSLLTMAGFFWLGKLENKVREPSQ